MIRSMTGFGEVSSHEDGVHYVVEVRSVNNRYFKAVIRLPDELSSFEPDLETLLRRKLARGSITLVVKRRLSGAAAAHQVNDGVLLAYLDHLETIHQKVAPKDQAVNIDLTALLALPGVLAPALDDEAVLQRARPVVMAMAKQACDRLVAMRETEGRAVAEDLVRQRNVIRQRLEEIAARAPQVAEDYHVRLRSRMQELLARAELKVHETDLIREVAIFAERADISEEISRISGHLEQFDQIMTLENGEPAGRTLDFLTQELLREANTIGSKCNDAQISRAIVEVKGAIDRMKEQVQNVE